ncbi:hypothetical protein ACQ4PT_072244 [Festuca glaucescens]
MVQMDYLDHWAALETNHSATSSGTTLALKGSILCIPATTNASMVLFIMAPGGKCLIIYMQGQGVKLPDLCVREESQEKPQTRGHLETEDGGMTLHHCVRYH